MTGLTDAFFRACDFVTALGPCVTEADLCRLPDQIVLVQGTQQDVLASLGITLAGKTDCVFAVLDVGRRIGNVTVHNAGEANVFVFGNSVQARDCNLTIRVHGSRCCVIFPNISQFPVNIAIAFLRSDEQLFYWGAGATSVMSRVEIEGAGRKLVVGDDCMLSSGVWIRNHDMHTLFDAESLEIFNPTKPDIIIEQHVWLGFDALILAAPRIGFGSVVGARSLLRESLPDQTVAAGIPAKVKRKGVAWCRSENGIQPGTLRRLDRLRAVRASGGET